MIPDRLRKHANVCAAITADASLLKAFESMRDDMLVYCEQALKQPGQREQLLAMLRAGLKSQSARPRLDLYSSGSPDRPPSGARL
jgi:hypothetical protein